MNKRIRMMEKAFPSFHAKKYFATTDKTQIPLRDFVLMLRKGAKNATKTLYETKDNGRWVEDTALCPVCDGDGEFITEDDVYTCSVCGGMGYITAYRYKKWCREME